jgi:hypothetical protein
MCEHKLNAFEKHSRPADTTSAGRKQAVGRRLYVIAVLCLKTERGL